MSEQYRIDREEAAARRNLLAKDVMERTGINEAMIAELVEKFYGRVRQDGDHPAPAISVRPSETAPADH